MQLLLSLTQVTVLLVPTYIDTGVQIWNAIAVNELSSAGQIKYEEPIAFRKETRCVYGNLTETGNCTCFEGKLVEIKQRKLKLLACKLFVYSLNLF